MMTGIEVALAAAAIASAAASAASSIQQGQAQAAAARGNARALRLNAGAARAAGQERARQVERKNRRLLGRGIANVGASGLAMGGSALDVLADNAAEAELARLSAIHLGDVQAIDLENRANIERARAPALQTAGFLSAAGTLLKAGGSVAGSGAFG